MAHIGGCKKIRCPLFGVPVYKEEYSQHSILGCMLGPLVHGNPHTPLHRP